MRDLISKGLLTAAAATSVLSLGGGHAFASDAQGTAAGSPGVLSGNNVQAPVDIPVNVCGNSVDVVALLNPAFGNGCTNVSARHTHRQYEQAHRDATAQSPARRDTAGTSAAPHSGRKAAPAPLPAPVHKPMPHPGHAPGQAVPSPAVPMGTPQSATPATPAHSAAPQHQQQHRPQQPQGRPHHEHPAQHQQHANQQHQRPTAAEVPQHRPTGATAGDQSVHAGTGSQASGIAHNSPGVLSGNLAQIPLDIPVNACGDTIDIIGLLNPAFGNHCESGTVPAPPSRPAAPPAPQPQHQAPPTPARHRTTPDVPVYTSSYVPPAPRVQAPQLAHTGADDGLLAAAGLSAGLLLGGSILYRRSTAPARARARSRA